jgi:hypothetical protein
MKTINKSEDWLVKAENRPRSHKSGARYTNNKYQHTAKKGKQEEGKDIFLLNGCFDHLFEKLVQKS